MHAEAMEDSDENEEEEEASSNESDWETDDDGEMDDVDGYEGQLAVYLLKHLCPKEDCNGAIVSSVADLSSENLKRIWPVLDMLA